MAFHVACPITTKRICFCKLGFPQKVQSEKAKKGFLEDVFRVEEFFSDSCSIRDTKKSGTVQVVVPKVVPEAAKTVVDGLKKRAVAGSIEAEDYGRKLEARGFALVENVGEAVRAIVEDQGVKVMCRLCFHTENEESDRANRMLGCKLCDKKYHRSCLISWGHNRDLFHLSSWVCPSCRTCEGCRKTGDVTKFVFCKRCDAAYHSSCQPHLSKNAFNGPYLCPKHTECHSCGSNVPGNGTSTRWFLGYTCCDACGRLFVKGNYCSVCLKVYRDSELTPMVCCDVCDHWVHCQCDGISEERYLQFQADGNLRYKCAACRGDCYKVTGLDDAVQELWRRRDIADRDQIATLRDSIGLPSEEAFSVSIYSDDEDNSPIVLKKEYEPLLKFSVKGSIHKETTNTKEYGKKLSNKKYGKKNEYKVPLNGEVSGHQTYEGLHDRRAIEFTLSDEKNDDIQLYRTEVMDILPPSARILGNTKENCSINQAGTMKHNFVEKAVANNEDRTPKVAQIKSSESHGPALGFCYGTQASKSENVKRKKLVIHLGARNSNINNSPRSEASSCHREQDVTAPNGTEDTMYRKVSKKYALEKTDGATRIHDSEGEKSGKRVQLTYSRNREGSSIKLGRFKPEVSVLTSESGKGNSTGPTAVGRDQVLLGRSKAGSEAALESGTGAPALRAEEIPLRRHSKGTPDIHIETCDRTHNTSTLDSSPKDPKPLLKLKFKSPHLNKRNSWVPQEEEKSSNKRQRSKRKRPETNQVSEEEVEVEEEEEEEGRTQVHQDSLVNEVMDANWILKKLGKDAIGKRVEVHHPADDSWHKGEVTDMIEGRTTIVVRLDDGGSKTLELGRQAIRFVSQKQKRSNS